MKKVAGHFIYLTQADERILKGLSDKRNESKSAVIRKLIRVEKYTKTLQEIENNNKIIATILKELAQIGININQIAYHLNADMTTSEQAQSDVEQELREFKIISQRLESILQEIKTNLQIRTHKKIKQQEQSELENATELTEILI